MRLKLAKTVKNAVFIGFFAFLIFNFATFANAENELVFKSNSNNEMKIALTFDDGPHPKKTEQILSILDKYEVKATFFVIGVNAVNYPNTLKKIVSSGHEIGNHTYTHKSASFLLYPYW